MVTVRPVSSSRARHIPSMTRRRLELCVSVQGHETSRTRRRSTRSILCQSCAVSLRRLRRKLISKRTRSRCSPGRSWTWVVKFSMIAISRSSYCRWSKTRQRRRLNSSKRNSWKLKLQRRLVKTPALSTLMLTPFLFSLSTWKHCKRSKMRLSVCKICSIKRKMS